MNEFNVIVVCAAIVLSIVAFNYRRADAHIAAAAAQAGLVQQVVKVPGYTPYVIWVKPPAAPVVELPEKP